MKKFNFQIITKDCDTNSNINDYKLYLDNLSKISVKSNADVLQIRIKSLPAMVIFDLAIYSKNLLDKYGKNKKRKPFLIVNDRPDIAYAAGADGVHIGQDDIPLKYAKKAFPSLIFGVSVKNPTQAAEAERNGADYIGIGPLYQTSSKEDAGCIINREDLKIICKNVKIPAIGIGGIDYNNLAEVLSAGLKGIAVISAVSGSKDPLNSAVNLKENIDKFINAA